MRAPISRRRCAPPITIPTRLERGEERLFALRAAARKYNVPVDNLAALAEQYQNDIALIDAGEEKLKALEETARAAEAAYRKAAEALSKARVKAGAALDKAVNGELKPLKLERAKFMTQIDSDAGGGRAERHRPGGVLGADQSGHAAGAADEGRLRRRTGALSVGAEGGAGRPRLGADVWCSTRSTPVSAARWRTPSACGWRGLRAAFRCWR